MKARFVFENIEFERGQDPKESMGIGNKEIQAIRKIGKHAEARGFKEAEIGPQHEEEGIINIKRWLYHSDMTNDDIEVVLYKEEDYPDDLMVYVATPQGDYQDSAEDWFDEITWDANLWETDDDVNEQIRFNFDKNPTDRFRVRHGESRPPVENPRKKESGLTPEEEEIVKRHEEKIYGLEQWIWNAEGQLQDLEGQLENVLNPQAGGEDEREQFEAHVQQKYGWNALDILNSGMSKEEKIKQIDALNPKEDFGDREFRMLMSDYEYYYPDEPDQEEIDYLEKEIKKINTQIKEKENTIEKLQTKIYNLETY